MLTFPALKVDQDKAGEGVSSTIGSNVAVAAGNFTDFRKFVEKKIIS